MLCNNKILFISQAPQSNEACRQEARKKWEPGGGVQQFVLPFYLLLNQKNSKEQKTVERSKLYEAICATAKRGSQAYWHELYIDDSYVDIWVKQRTIYDYGLASNKDLWECGLDFATSILYG